VPEPEDCRELDTALFGVRPSPWGLIEARPGPASPRAGAWAMWFRFRGEALAEDAPAEAVVTYLSDLTLAGTTKRSTKRHPEGRPDVRRLTSLDHSVWFHGQPQLSSWLLYAKAAPTVGPQRGLAIGQIFNHDGTLVATVAQEVLLR